MYTKRHISIACAGVALAACSTELSPEELALAPVRAGLLVFSGLESDAPLAELKRVSATLRAELEQEKHLQQKLYLKDPERAVYASMMVFDTPAQARAYAQSDNYKRRISAYPFTTTAEARVFEIVDQLRAEPLAAEPGAMPVALLVSKLRSGLPPAEMLAAKDARKPQFRDVPGLLQKYYLRDPASGTYAGLYIFASPAHAMAYRDSDLRKSMKQAYKLRWFPKVERFGVSATLHPLGSTLRAEVAAQ